jgi:Zn-dependent protease
VKWSFQLARISGIDVRVHATFFLLLAWFGFVYYESGGWEAMLSGLLFIVLLFVCVLLHEFGHALAARAYGINTPDITLLPIGGVARLERMPEKPVQELVVALAGPAVNVVIALGLVIVLGRFFAPADLDAMAEGRANLLVSLLAINVTLVFFNLLPAFPMDGGRVLRALLAMRLKHAKATRIAAFIGQAVAVIFALYGLYHSNPFLIIIAVFVFLGARAEAGGATVKELADETTVASVMLPVESVLMDHMTVAEAVASAMTVRSPLLPVVDSSMRLVGTIPAATLAGALRVDPRAGIRPLLLAPGDVIAASAPLAEAIRIFRQNNQVSLPVLNASGQIVGTISRHDLQQAFASVS